MADPANNSNVFLQSTRSRYTYADLNAFIRYFKQVIPAKALETARPVGLLTASCNEAIFIIAACWKLGVPFVCFNPDEDSTTLAEQIDVTVPGIIFTDDYTLTGRNTIFSDIHQFSSEHWSPPVSAPPQIEAPADDQVFGYFFTSGTTSKPKIVPLKRRQIYAAAEASKQNLAPVPNDLWLLCMPLNHIGGVSVILRSLIYQSGIYRMDKFNRLVAPILSSNTTIKVASLVPTMLKRLLQDPKFNPHEELRILLGGGPIHPSLVKNIEQTDINVISSYGMTETCAQIAAGPLGSQPDEAPNAGTIFEPNTIQIRDGNDEKCAPGKMGTIWLKGPQVFDGYLQRSRKGNFDKNGWFNTGDFGKLGPNGRLTVSTRRTDLIVTGGENVSPPEVEEVLLNQPGIAEVAVIGLPSDEWGELVGAAWVANDSDNVNIQQLKTQLKEDMAPYKIPKRWVGVDALPRTASGKVKRKKLAELFD